MIEIEQLRKTFKGHEALCGVNLAVEAGTVLGLLGPNGAGKTTIVRILSTLLAPDGGTARVAGFDVCRQPNEVRSRIGLTGQHAAVDERLTGEENLRLIGTLLHLGRTATRARTDELLEKFELTDAASRVVKTYSGGMRRRIDLAASLMGNPPVLFLDEPTTGLDPSSRRVLWELVRDQMRRGVTVLLTTQYLEEADELADRIVVVSSGSVVADGTADELKRMVGGERLEVTLSDAADAPRVADALARSSSHPPVVAPGGASVSIPLLGGMTHVAELATAVEATGIPISGFSVRRPSLDDVFLELTGPDQQPVSIGATDHASARID